MNRVSAGAAATQIEPSDTPAAKAIMSFVTQCTLAAHKNSCTLADGTSGAARAGAAHKRTATLQIATRRPTPQRPVRPPGRRTMPGCGESHVLDYESLHYKEKSGGVDSMAPPAYMLPTLWRAPARSLCKWHHARSALFTHQAAGRPPRIVCCGRPAPATPPVTPICRAAGSRNSSLLSM